MSTWQDERSVIGLAQISHANSVAQIPNLRYYPITQVTLHPDTPDGFSDLMDSNHRLSKSITQMPECPRVALSPRGWAALLR